MAVFFFKRIDVISCNSFNPHAIIVTFENYQRSVEFLVCFSIYIKMNNFCVNLEELS